MKRVSAHIVVVIASILLGGIQLAVPAQGPADLQFVTMWGTFGEEPSQFNAPEAVSVSADGEIFVADTYNHRVQVFSSEGELLRTWGSLCDLSEIDDCQNPEGNGQFFAPEGIAVDSERERVYVVDSSNDRVQVFDLEGNFITKWGSSGSAVGELSLPIGIDVDGDGNLYVADLLNHRIQVFQPDGTFTRMWGSRGADAGQLNFPADLAVYQESVYVTENANSRVQQFDLEGNSIRTWGSACDLATSEGCDSQSGAGQFLRPFGIAADDEGNIYVVDQSNHRMQSFTADGEFLAQLGSVCALFGNDDVPAGTGCQSVDGEGQFFFPKGIDVGPGGRVVVADSDNHRVQVFE